MQEQYYFVVEGSGEFPLDMLRYDQCWPAGPSSVAAINATGLRKIALRTYSNKEAWPGVLTPTRWESFTWRIVETQ